MDRPLVNVDFSMLNMNIKLPRSPSKFPLSIVNTASKLFLLSIYIPAFNFPNHMKTFPSSPFTFPLSIFHTASKLFLALHLHSHFQFSKPLQNFSLLSIYIPTFNFLNHIKTFPCFPLTVPLSTASKCLAAFHIQGSSYFLGQRFCVL